VVLLFLELAFVLIKVISKMKVNFIMDPSIFDYFVSSSSHLHLKRIHQASRQLPLNVLHLLARNRPLQGAVIDAVALARSARLGVHKRVDLQCFTCR
jgi:hypothetical protein